MFHVIKFIGSKSTFKILLLLATFLRRFMHFLWNFDLQVWFWGEVFCIFFFLCPCFVKPSSLTGLSPSLRVPSWKSVWWPSCHCLPKLPNFTPSYKHHNWNVFIPFFSTGNETQSAIASFQLRCPHLVTHSPLCFSCVLFSPWRAFVLFCFYRLAMPLFSFYINFLYIRTKSVSKHNLPTCPEYPHSIFKQFWIGFHLLVKLLIIVTSKISILPNLIVKS